MKLALAVWLLLVTGGAMAQDDPNWPPASYLRNDYRHSVVVAQVRVTQAEIVQQIPGYDDWRLVGEVIERFKGKFRKGQTIAFYHGAETGYKKELFVGEKIIFLHRNYVEKEKRWVYAVIENSTLANNEDRVRKLRIIKRAARKPRPRCIDCRTNR
ncbi:MAG TPA: hypothetical protein VE863_02545 [Pyrinomonadaceae bacterium]|jgi:hypothetical protein|nr:hypothetical protein [Pyrinomonadaceae bacterium]